MTDNAKLFHIQCFGQIALGFRVALLACFLCVWVPTAIAQTSTNSLRLTPLEQQWVDQNPSLKVAVAGDDPPYQFINEQGQFDGIYARLLEVISARSGLTFEIVINSWNEQYPAVIAGNFALTPAISRLAVPTDSLVFSEPVLESLVGVYTQNDPDKIRDISTLSEQVIAVEAAHVKEFQLRQRYPKLTLYYVEDAIQGIALVDKGDVDGFIGHHMVSEFLIDRYFSERLTLGSFYSLKSSEWSFGVNPRYPELLSILNKAIESLSEEDVSAIVAQYQSGSLSYVGSLDLSDSEREWLRSHPQIRMGIDPQWLPFEAINEQQQYIGIIAEYVAWLAERLDVSLEPTRDLSWTQALAAYRREEIDIFPGMSPTPQRRDNYLFTQPYLSFPMVLITTDDAPFISGLKALHGQRVAVVDGYATMEYLTNDHPEIEIITKPNLLAALEAVNRGEADAAFDSLAAVTYNIRSYDIRGLKVAATTPYEFDLAFAVRKDWPELVSIINKTLMWLPKEQRQSFYDQWVNVRTEQAVNWRALWQTVAVILLIGAVIVGIIMRSNRKLAAEVTERKRVEDILLKIKWDLQAIFDSAQVGILLTRKGLYVERCNDRLVSQFAYRSPRDLVGHEFSELFPDSKLFKQYMAECSALLTNGGQFKTELKLKMADGRRLWCSVAAKALDRATPPNLDNGIIWVIDDISERKKAQQATQDQLRFQAALIDTIPNPIFIKDPQGRYVSCNRAYEQVHNVKRADIIGKTMLEVDFLPESLRMLYHEEDARLLRDGGMAHEEASLELADGRIHHVIYWVTAFDLSDETRGGLVGVIVDVTELKLAQEKAEQATQAKSDFLANMSHEIRTPMNAIIGMSHLALMTELNPKQRDYLRKIDDSAKALLRIINDILDFSKIEAGKLSIEETPFNLESVLSDVANLVQMNVDKKGLELLFHIAKDVPVELLGDGLRLGQILLNLVSNAVKFTEQGEIIVKVDTLRARADEVELKFAVIDTGIGLSDEQQSRLFQSFSQADGSTTRKYGGTGLGLAICKRLSELMGGNIGVNSEPGQGAQFWFTVKLKPNQEQVIVRRTASDFVDLPVLIVDDNQASRQILCEQLTNIGCKPYAVASGEEALAYLQDAPVDSIKLILMDWKMPQLDGIETVRKIRQLMPDSVVPQVIMVSVYSREEVLSHAGEIGVSHCLTKPVNPSTLVDTLMEVFQQPIELGNADRHEPISHDALRVALAGKRILLVEDNLVNQQVASELLAEVGVEVTIANHGQEALDLLAADRFDLVLMDVQMPVMDGYTATQKIRQQQRFNSLPILAMTANVMQDDIERCRHYGMQGHIAKPIDPPVMFETIAGLLAPDVALDEALEAPADEQALPEILNQLTELNTVEGLRRCGGKVERYLSVVEHAAAHLVDLCERLAKSANDDIEQLTFTLHTLKGEAATIGAEQLAQQAAQAEQACHTQGMLSQSLLDALCSGAQRLHTQVQEMLATQRTESNTASLNSEEWQLALVNLARQIEDFDATAADECQQLMTHQIGEEQSQVLKRVQQALIEYDFERAAKILNPLLGEGA